MELRIAMDALKCTASGRLPNGANSWPLQAVTDRYETLRNFEMSRGSVPLNFWLLLSRPWTARAGGVANRCTAGLRFSAFINRILPEIRARLGEIT